MSYKIEDELGNLEREAAACDGWEAEAICKLVSLARSLRHELNDPNYLYGDSRIHRQAILFRDAQIAALHKRLENKGEQ